jgi:hypothetical protein
MRHFWKFFTFGALFTFVERPSLSALSANDTRTADPLWLAVDQKQEALFLNSGNDRLHVCDELPTKFSRILGRNLL